MKSILDNDLYKYTQQHAVCAKFPRQIVKYDFFNRGKTEFPDGFAKELQERIKSCESISLTKDEYDFVRERCYFLTLPYLDFLKAYRFDSSEVSINQIGSKLNVSVTGHWYKAILWEVVLMYTISELYFEMTKQLPISREQRLEINKEKAEFFEKLEVKVSEFGTRRRYSYHIQEEAIADLLVFGHEHITGTSNVHFAHKYNLTPQGTQAHEWISAHAALYGYRMANEMAMENWVDVYQGNLGTVLTDTFTTRKFLESFNTKYAKLFDSVRQDSGDSIQYIDWIVNHYKKLKIDPITKTIIFSDGINSYDLLEKIHLHCKDKIKDAYGVGTWLTNDVGVKPLNIVIKMTGCLINSTWCPVVKLSDIETKHTGDVEEIELCKKTLKIV